MYERLIKLFIKNADQTQDAHVRTQYGIITAMISIILNATISFAKIIFGYLSHSQAMIADGINNFSDATSNICVLIGFKVAGKHADEDHPYGHGRYEYIAGVVVAILIIAIGSISLKDAIIKVIHPVKVVFKVSSLCVLLMGIGVKAIMYVIDLKTANIIDSDTYRVAATDSLNDIVTTSAAIIALLCHNIKWPIDGLIGTGVSIFVLYGGINALQSTMTPLIGQRPDPSIVKEIERTILSNNRILGLHDMSLHDYGVNQRFLTVHCEVDASENLVAIHDVIDKIERELLARFGIHASIHIDPIDRNDPLTKTIYQQVSTLVHDIDESYSIHDFRIKNNSSTIDLYFDVLIPYSDTIDENVLIDTIQSQLSDIDQRYISHIDIDHLLV